MGRSSIEWTESTWNPVTGCTPVSPGCANCYARRMAQRLAAMPSVKHRKRYKGFKVSCWPERLEEPLHWRKPRMVFPCSMGDLFHKDVPFEFIDKVFAVMASASQHVFQVLTKRVDRMAAWFRRVAERGPVHQNLYTSGLIDFYQRHNVDLARPHQVPTPPTPELRFIYDSADGIDPHARIEDRPRRANKRGNYHWRRWPLSNVWLGVTAEDQERADERIPILLDIPAAVRFVSCEPLLGEVGLGLLHYRVNADKRSDIDLVIAGGETGPGARPSHPDHFRSLRDQCAAAGVPFFLKHLGEYAETYRFDTFQHWVNKASTHVAKGDVCLDLNSKVCRVGKDFGEARYPVVVMTRVGRKLAGRLLDGEEHNALPGGDS